MRRLALLLVGGAVWLFLAAIPVFADGGPHQMNVNNGSAAINADSCAGCHRIHSAKSGAGGGMLLANPAATISDFCLTCHGKVGAGATTDVETGLQYYLATGASSATDKTTGTKLGALRGGGFEKARIASNQATRKLTFTTVGNEPGRTNAKIPVLADATTATSAHIALAGVTLNTTDKTWGNGSINSGQGTAFNGGLECTSCHNPHGNGQYRILKPLPGDGSGGMTEATTGVVVFDDTTHTGAGTQTRNYTVIQVEGQWNVPSTWLLTAQDVIDARNSGIGPNASAGDYSVTSGDYFHKFSQYNTTRTSSSTGAFDAPNASQQFTRQMAAWCSTCHTRYYVTGGGRTASSGDSIFTYRHTSAGPTRACTTCHVSHGSNAAMNNATGTTYSRDLKDPSADDTGAVRTGDSRLLKVDNRGTCLLCHEPTNGSSFPSSATTGDVQVQGTPPTNFP